MNNASLFLFTKYVQYLRDEDNGLLDRLGQQLEAYLEKTFNRPFSVGIYGGTVSIYSINATLCGLETEFTDDKVVEALNTGYSFFHLCWKLYSRLCFVRHSYRQAKQRRPSRE